MDRKLIAFCPLPVPHSFYGNSPNGCAPQNARTADQINSRSRGSEQFAEIHGHQRWPDKPTRADRQSCRRPSEYDPPGCNRTAAGTAQSVHFPDLEALDQDAEDLTGVSRLSQGLNKDAISKQNSAAMVEQLATMSQQLSLAISSVCATTVS